MTPDSVYTCDGESGMYFDGVTIIIEPGCFPDTPTALPNPLALPYHFLHLAFPETGKTRLAVSDLRGSKSLESVIGQNKTATTEKGFVLESGTRRSSYSVEVGQACGTLSVPSVVRFDSGESRMTIEVMAWGCVETEKGAYPYPARTEINISEGSIVATTTIYVDTISAGAPINRRAFSVDEERAERIWDGRIGDFTRKSKKR
jgi:hypothetical protein